MGIYIEKIIYGMDNIHVAEVKEDGSFGENKCRLY